MLLSLDNGMQSIILITLSKVHRKGIKTHRESDNMKLQINEVSHAM